MNGLYQLLIPIIDWALRIIGCAALVIIAFFICWWFGSGGFFIVSAICIAIAIGITVYGAKHGWLK
jgi:hypothetical protein